MIHYFADDVCKDETRLPVLEIRELQIQMNCNLYASDDAELYFLEDDEFASLTIMSETQFFETFIL